MPATIFGIRHHGPGSARALVQALDELRPRHVLIEGPADASDLLPMLADPAMRPPVALLVYDAASPEKSGFWPFAAFSPEYQAALWAVKNHAELRFIDIPAGWRFAGPDQKPDHAHDPLGALAEAAGYTDGESFWRDVIEENPAPGPVFAAVAEAMAAVRESALPPAGFEAAREAHMRLEIAKAEKTTGDHIAVVCGAWHVPALTTKTPAAQDRAALKPAEKTKTAATWAPWTSPRLAASSGYGAGVTSPGWCDHLWHTPAASVVPAWLAKIAAAVRADGHLVSTASLIEAQRLAIALAALRGRPSPGFEELREAAIATLCFGEPLLWQTVAARLLIGADVGEIPANVPAAPLLEDLQREQKRLQLKPEALDRDLALDLRTKNGLDRSTLLHRLNILSVGWGRLAEARGRGTFREQWVLRWVPEFAVSLVENLIYGATIAQAAAGRLRADLAAATTLNTLAALISAALTAQLPDEAAAGIALIARRAAHTSDCLELLAALPPLASLLRYGEARPKDATQLAALVSRILVQASVALPYAARALDAPAAAALRAAMLAANASLALADCSPDDLQTWQSAITTLTADPQCAPLIAGGAARLLYEAEKITPDDAATLLSRMFSPGRALADAAAFFEGFFEGAGERLIYDSPLRAAVDTWLNSLSDEDFTASLPLFRRAFANLDRMQRKRLLDALFGRASAALPGLAPAADAAAIWPAHLAAVTAILSLPQADEFS